MRFKKGSKVKVMNEEVPGSWRVAEVVSGNGYRYQGVEKVSKGNIRPYPGAIRSERSWKTGDIVEVFDDNTWKIATVLKVLKGGRYSVRPHEFSDEIKACKTSIRARQSWCDRGRIPVGKVLRTNEAEPTSAASQSQRRSFEKTFFLVMGNLLIHHGWNMKLRVTIGGMHLLLPKVPSKILVLLSFSWKKEWDISAYLFATDKTIRCLISQFVAIWHIPVQLKHGGSLTCHYLLCQPAFICHQSSLVFR